MTEHRFRPGKEWGSKARKAEDAPGRKAQERQAAIEDQCGYCPGGRCVEFIDDTPYCETDVTYCDVCGFSWEGRCPYH